MQIIKKGHIYKYVIVPVSEVDAIWDNIKHEVARTNDKVFNDEDVKLFINEGIYTLWLIIENKTNDIIANFTTEYVFYPRDKICRIVTMSGNRMNDWVNETLSMIENWAKEQGCSYMDSYGRKGWKKFLKDYSEHSILFRKQL
mgnify:CR=1 FL=1|tara:strand:- start:82 stop:510 length:429 start_codon:yes stop_codon:yes gene_type:complete